MLWTILGPAIGFFAGCGGAVGLVLLVASLASAGKNQTSDRRGSREPEEDWPTTPRPVGPSNKIKEHVERTAIRRTSRRSPR